MNALQRCAACVVFTMFLLAGCAKAGSPGDGSTGNQPSSTFPVYAPSTIASVGKYDDSDEVTRLGSSFFGEGADAAYPYVGTQELIRTGASLDELDGWIKQLIQSPPQGLAPGDSSSDPLQSTGKQVNQPAVDALNVFGLVPMEFWSKDRRRVVMLIVLDPKRVADRMAATIGVIEMWEKMPAPLRAGMDQTIKKQAGFSASDLTDTSTPIGMIMYAARTWKSADARAIILVDAERQPNPLPTPHDK
ncbi:MAG TPA: hypothetical protein VIX35_14140 [Vicinamibacterales bacterium]